jgi:hypothetical protein
VAPNYLDSGVALQDRPEKQIHSHFSPQKSYKNKVELFEEEEQ